MKKKPTKRLNAPFVNILMRKTHINNCHKNKINSSNKTINTLKVVHIKTSQRTQNIPNKYQSSFIRTQHTHTRHHRHKYY